MFNIYAYFYILGKVYFCFYILHLNLYAFKGPALNPSWDCYVLNLHVAGDEWTDRNAHTHVKI